MIEKEIDAGGESLKDTAMDICGHTVKQQWKRGKQWIKINTWD